MGSTPVFKNPVKVHITSLVKLAVIMILNHCPVWSSNVGRINSGLCRADLLWFSSCVGWNNSNVEQLNSGLCVAAGKGGQNNTFETLLHTIRLQTLLHTISVIMILQQNQRNYITAASDLFLSFTFLGSFLHQ